MDLQKNKFALSDIMAEPTDFGLMWNESGAMAIGKSGKMDLLDRETLDSPHYLQHQYRDVEPVHPF
jgi:hypothetical protein